MTAGRTPRGYLIALFLALVVALPAAVSADRSVAAFDAGSVSAAASGTRVVTVESGSGSPVVLVDREPFVFKGFVYVGSAIPDRWPAFSFAEDVAACENDAALMGAAGVTALRIWLINTSFSDPPGQDLACLDAFWEHGIGVVWTVAPPGAVDTAAWWEAYQPVLDQALDRYADHPATLVWLLGNEMDLGACQQLDPSTDCLDDVFGVEGGRVGQLNRALAYIKERDPNHLVGTTICCPLERMRTANLPALDIWGLNQYPRLHAAPARQRFADLLNRIDTWDPSRPKLYTEMGTDRYWCAQRVPAGSNTAGCATTAGATPPQSSGEYQQPQADYLGAAWDLMAPHLADTTGNRGRGRATGGTLAGVTFQVWTDMWNFCSVLCHGAGTPVTHEIFAEGAADGPISRAAADGMISREWWGATHAIPKDAGYTRATTLAFDALARRWAAVPPPTITAAPQVTSPASPCLVDGQAEVTWSTSLPATSEVYTSAPGAVVDEAGFVAQDNAIYEPAVTDDTLVEDHAMTFVVPPGGRGQVIVRSFTATGQSVTWPSIDVTCGDL